MATKQRNREVVGNRNRAYYAKHRDELLPKMKKNSRAYYLANRECLLAKSKAYRAEHKALAADWHRRRLYGLPIGGWDRMLEGQGGLCSLCRSRKAECVDHNHSTGLVRGLLCRRCNLLLTALDDPAWVAMANEYLAGKKQ